MENCGCFVPNFIRLIHFDNRQLASTDQKISTGPSKLFEFPGIVSRPPSVGGLARTKLQRLCQMWIRWRGRALWSSQSMWFDIPYQSKSSGRHNPTRDRLPQRIQSYKRENIKYLCRICGLPTSHFFPVVVFLLPNFFPLFFFLGWDGETLQCRGVLSRINRPRYTTTRQPHLPHHTTYHTYLCLLWHPVFLVLILTVVTSQVWQSCSDSTETVVPWHHQVQHPSGSRSPTGIV